MKSLIGLVLKHKALTGLALMSCGGLFFIISVICTSQINLIIASIYTALLVIGMVLIASGMKKIRQEKGGRYGI